MNRTLSMDPMFPLIFSRYLSFAPTSPDKKRREIWGAPIASPVKMLATQRVT